jgi:fibronectin type 3 domain-containing protein
MQTTTRFGLAGAIAVGLAVAGCNNNNNSTGPAYTLTPPDSLTYQLQFGDPNAAIIVAWQVPDSTNIEDFVVYGNLGTVAAPAFSRFAIVTSNSYHDVVVEPQYFVTSQDQYGDESATSDTVTVNFADSVQTPNNLAGVAYDSAAVISWGTLSQTGYNASRFEYYRVYSMPWTGSACNENGLALEGTTVSSAFVITGLANGVTTCYTVTAVSLSGLESQFANPFVSVTPSSGAGPFSASLAPAGSKIIIAGKERRVRGHSGMVKTVNVAPIAVAAR